MENKKNKNRKKKGILTRIRTLLERNRLGELLVLNGVLTPTELRSALLKQKSGQGHLGLILVEQRVVSQQDLRRALRQQWTLRCMAAALTLFISFSSFAIKPAKAGSIKDVPAQIHLADIANPAFTKVRSYPALFGTEERVSRNIDAFTKWSDMFERFDAAMKSSSGQKVVQEWKRDLAAYKGLPLYDMAEKVNHLVNAQRYIVDSKNWGKSDYWETPVEFFTKGGDCEDFAIAKYASLRALGVPEERLRVAIVHDEIKDIPHAVLVVYTDKGAIILDNQTENPVYTSDTRRYRPIFSINRQAWWLHTKPATTIIASAQ